MSGRVIGRLSVRRGAKWHLREVSVQLEDGRTVLLPASGGGGNFALGQTVIVLGARLQEAQ
jgi:hypothetical protein